MKIRRLPFNSSKVVSYAANANAPLLGLTEAEYESIRVEVTDVIHVRSSSTTHEFFLTHDLRTLGQ